MENEMAEQTIRGYNQRVRHALGVLQHEIREWKHMPQINSDSLIELLNELVGEIEAKRRGE